MILKNKSNIIIALGIFASVIFWLLDAIIDVLFFGDADDSILESIFSPSAHELYMRGLVLILFLLVSFFTRRLLLKQEIMTLELEKHKYNLEELVKVRTEKLEKLATTDHLTQINNRRKFFELAEYEIKRNRRLQHPISVIVIDIDHFKKINDTYGHQTGDDVLQKFAQVISSIIRDTDIFGRIGGEEFSVLLPETTEEDAKDFAQRIRLCIENEKFPNINNMTISLGITNFHTDDTVLSLFHRADTALFSAKKTGRNRVVVA